jgi:hypothetical protein
MFSVIPIFLGIFFLGYPDPIQSAIFVSLFTSMTGAFILIGLDKNRVKGRLTTMGNWCPKCRLYWFRIDNITIEYRLALSPPIKPKECPMCDEAIRYQRINNKAEEWNDMKSVAQNKTRI